MKTTIIQIHEQKNMYELLLENDAFICFNLFEQVLFCVSHPHNQWCSLVFCSEYTVIIFSYSPVQEQPLISTITLTKQGSTLTLIFRSTCAAN